MKRAAFIYQLLFLLPLLLLSQFALAGSDQLKLIQLTEKTINNMPVINLQFNKQLDTGVNNSKYLKVVDENNYQIYGTWIIDEDERNIYFTDIQPNRTYTININGLHSKDKSTLENKLSKQITTKNLKPVLGFASQGSILPKNSNSGLPIMTINVDTVNLQFLYVKPHMLPNFLDRYYLGNITNSYQFNDLHKYAEQIYQGQYEIQDKTRNKRITSNIDLHTIKNLGKPGMYIALMTQPGVFTQKYKTSYFFISDIGLHARKYENNIDVYAVSLNDGSVLKDVNLKLYTYSNLLSSSATTDSDGYASLKLSKQRNIDSLIIARKGDEISYLKVNTSALDLSEFAINGTIPTKLNGYIFSNRDLFRPGETVPLSFLLKDYDGKPVDTRPVYLTITDPSGAKYKKYTVKPADNGYIEKKVWIPENAKTGKWRVVAHTSSNIYSSIGQFEFNVEEFLPERIKLELKAKDKIYRSKQNIEVELNANYLYGAPASNNKAKATSVITTLDFPSKKYSKFYFGNHKQSKKPVRKDIFDGKLNDKGNVKLSFMTPDEVKSPLSASVIASVFESGGRAINRSIRKQVWPSETIIGVKPRYIGGYAPLNQNINFDLVNIDKDEKVKGLKDVNVRLIYEERRYHWFYDEHNGWDSKYTQLDHEKYESKINTKDGQIAKISLPAVNQYGRYRLEIESKDKKIFTSYRFRLGWFADDSESNRPSKVSLSLDKDGYKTGETATLDIKPPHSGNALILVESDKRLFSKTIYVPKEGLKTDIPIDKSWDSHNIYVSAVVFRKASQKDEISPQRAIGVTHLPLDRIHRTLELKIDAVEKSEPNKDIELKINVHNTNGKKAWVKISATDVGILNITDFKTPKPQDHFFAKQRYTADSYDLYGKVIESRKGKLTKQRFGGDADMSGKRKNRLPKAKVKLIAISKQLIQTDENGFAAIKLKSPDFNGKIKITAVAFTDDSYGSTETETIIAAPIVAEISTPKFLSDNDAAMIALDIQNLSGEDQDIEFELSTTQPLKINNYSAMETIADKQKKTFFFEISASDYYGIGKLRLDLKSSKGNNLIREWELAVRPAYPSENRTFMTTVAKDKAITLDKKWIEGLSEKTTEVDIVVSNTPPFNLNSIAKGLFGYPYGCLEQTTSKAFANLYIDDKIANKIGHKPISNDKRVELHEKAVSRLAGMQLSNGGFGLWNSRSPEQPWLSAYVADYLLTAKDFGFEAPDEMLEKLLYQLNNRINGRSISVVNRLYTRDSQHLAFASEAYAAYILSKVNRIDLSSLRNMYEFRKTQSKSGLPLVHLGAALINMGDKKLGTQAIKDGLKVERAVHYLGDYGTKLRDAAQMYHVMNTANVKITNNLLHQIWQESKSNSYLSTQERVSILRAGFADINEKIPFTVSVMQDDIEERFYVNKFFSKTFKASDINAGTELKFISDEDLFVYAAVSGFPAQPPQPKMTNFEITRNLYSMDGKPIDKRVFDTGDMVIVHLRIRADRYYDNAMVIDMLPAGLEIENLNISKGEGLGNTVINGINPGQTMQGYNIKHIEFRDDRYVAAVAISPNNETHLFYILRAVSPGVYTVPPAFAEDMYRPQFNGIGVTNKPITVQK